MDNTEVSGLKSVLARSDELVTASSDALYSYDSRLDRLLEAGPYCAFTHTAQEAAWVNSQQDDGDTATANGVTVYAWEDSRGGIRASLYNAETGAPYSVDFSVAAATAVNPKCIAVGPNLLVLYADTSVNNVVAKVINSNDITTSLAASVVTIVEDVNASADFDAVGSDLYGFLLYTTDGSFVTGTRLCRFNSSGAGLVFSGPNPVSSIVGATVALSYNADTDQVTGVTWAGGNYDQFVLDSDLALVDLNSDGEADVVTVATAQLNTVDSLGVLFKTKGTGPDADNYTVEISQDGAAGVTVRHVTLASSAFVVGDYAYAYVLHLSRTGLQNHYYLLRHDGKLVGRVLTGEGISTIIAPLPRVGTDYSVVLPFRRRLNTRDTSSPVATTSYFEQRGMKHVRLDVEATPRGDELDQLLYLSGSQLWVYDGSNTVESGFHMWPDMLSGDITLGAAGSMPSSGTRSYRIYYEWTTANGRRYRSAAITRVSPVMTGDKVEIEIPTLSCTLKADVSIVVYRDDGTGIFWYRVSSSDPTTAGTDNGYVANDVTVDSVTFTDDMPDADLTDQEVDYVSSQGERPNFGPEGPTNVAVAQGRLWLCGGGQRPNNVRYSKLHFDGEPVEFAGFEVSEAPDYGGDTVAVSHIGEAVCVFKERAVYAIDGQGPDNTGGGGVYVPRPLSSDNGCTEPGCVLSTSEGVYFKSPEGIQRLNPDGTFEYIGAEVEAYNDQACVSATSVPDTNHIVFLMSSGSTLMYDTYYRQWSTYTNHAGLGATVWQGDTYVYLRADGYLMLRDSGLYADAGVTYTLKFRTAPMRLTDVLQGFYRVVDLGVLGTYYSSHELVVGVYYDRQEAPYYAFTWEPDDVLELSEWGDGSWGDDSWGGAIATRDYRFEHKFMRQKCETVSLEFEDRSIGPALGASFEITELALGVRARKGMGRIAATRKI